MSVSKISDRQRLTQPSSGISVKRLVYNNQSGTVLAGKDDLTDYVYIFTGSGSLVLPIANGNSNVYDIKNNSTVPITVEPGNFTIDDSSIVTLKPSQSIRIISDQTNYKVISSSLNLNQLSTFKISYLDGALNTIYESDSLTAMFTYVNGYTKTGTTTVRFNTSDTYLLTSSFQILDANINNGTNFIIIKAANGQTPTFDVQFLDNTVMSTNLGYCVFEGLTFKNALYSGGAAENGCNVRHFGNAVKRTNITYRNCFFSNGYCAMRMTDGIGIAVIEDCTVDNFTYGSFRVGNGVTIDDITNLRVSRIKMLNTQDQNILYTTAGSVQVKNSCYMQFRNIRTLLVEDIDVIPNEFGRNNTAIMSIVGSTLNTTITRIRARGWGYNLGGFAMAVEYADNVTLTNINLIPHEDDGVSKSGIYFNESKNIRLQHSTLYSKDANWGSFSFTLCKQILSLKGNIFKFSSIQRMGINYDTRNGYVPTLANDLVEEKYNLYFYDNNTFEGAIFADFPEVTETSKRVTNDGVGGSITLANWRSVYNRGQGSIISDANTAYKFIKQDIRGYMTSTSSGVGTIPQNESAVTVDNYGASRIFPTDMGCLDRQAVRSKMGFSLPLTTISTQNDTTNIFDILNLVGTPDFEYESTVNSGLSYNLIKPLALDDKAYSIGQVGIRRIGNYFRIPSNTLFNTAAYTASYSPNDLYVPFFSKDSNEVWTNPNGLTYANSVRTNINQLISANQSFRIWIKTHALNTGTAANGTFGLFTTNTSADNAPVKLGIWYLNYGVDAIRYYLDNSFTEVRLNKVYWGLFRDTSNNIRLQHSSDGVTWIDQVTIVTYGGELYPGLRFDVYGRVASPKITIFI